MKRAFLLTWVFLSMAATGFTNDLKGPEYLKSRKSECEKLSQEFGRQAAELETKAKDLEEDESKALIDLAKIKREESENFSELAEAFDKKQWSTISRLEKKGGKLCEEWSEKWAKFEKKKGGELREKKSVEMEKKPLKPNAPKSEVGPDKEPLSSPDPYRINEKVQALGAP